MWRLITCCTLSLALGGYSTSDPVVDLGYGRYQGVVNAASGNLEYLGIRYAASPTGDLRWRAPQAPRRELRVHVADDQPNKCYQTFPGTAPSNPFRVGVANGNKTLEARQSPAPIESEDCLFLNVYTPSAQLQLNKKLPVVVWLHGGAYLLGSASGSGFGPGGPYEGTELIKRAGGNAIVVVVQYRLGLFGFLAGTEVKRDGALNAGLLDQEFAFRWVQQHIRKFGGDPSQVTIWGQSAGAGSVLQHLIANGGDTHPPLFKSAITSSLFIPSQYPYDHRIPEAIYSHLTSLAGCSTSDSLKCLREADAGKLQAANLQIAGEAFTGTFPWVPVVDGTFIRESPIEALQEGKLNSRRVLTMTNAGESVGIFVPPNMPSNIDVANYVQNLFPTISPQVAAAAAAQYEGLGSNPQQITSLYTEVIFFCPTYALLKQLDGKGYKGSLDVPPAMHGDDLSYLFPGITTAPASFDNTQFAQAFTQSFMDFVLSGDPNVKCDPTSILPTWKPWSPSSPNEVSFNRTGDAPNIAAVSSDSGLLKRCQFWVDNSQLIAQ